MAHIHELVKALEENPTLHPTGERDYANTFAHLSYVANGPDSPVTRAASAFNKAVHNKHSKKGGKQSVYAHDVAVTKAYARLAIQFQKNIKKPPALVKKAKEIPPSPRGTMQVRKKADPEILEETRRQLNARHAEMSELASPSKPNAPDPNAALARSKRWSEPWPINMQHSSPPKPSNSAEMERLHAEAQRARDEAQRARDEAQKAQADKDVAMKDLAGLQGKHDALMDAHDALNAKHGALSAEKDNLREGPRC